uniref:Nucleolar protein 11 n=1 Tax=Neolamprologus brichardi TaxID=32507 RepID=A0A3Q4G8J4_NEOBR
KSIVSVFHDILLDKAFKATVSSDVWKVHCTHGGEPVVLFQRGAVRLLDSLLAAPQQPIEEVLAQEEAIRWSAIIVTETQQFIIITTEQKGEHFLYLQRLNPNSVQRYRLEREEPGLSPLSFSATYRDKHICLLYLYPNGHVYQSVLSVRGLGTEEGVQALPLPRSLLLGLPVGDGQLEAASAMALDEAHVAVVGVPHPSTQICSNSFELCLHHLCVDFIVSLIQLWSYSNKVFIPHGKTLSIIPFECPKSSLASALGKLKHTKTEGELNQTCHTLTPNSVPSWNNILHGEKAQPSKSAETRRTVSWISVFANSEFVIVHTVTAPVEEIQKEVEGFLTRAEFQDLQPSVGQLALTLVSRSLADPAFYSSSTLAQLVHTRCLCHSVCPDLVLLALEKKDYFLCQLCLQFFPDIPEAVTCACLKTRAEDVKKASAPSQLICPVGLHKAVLINEILQTPYSDTFLLPHLKDLSSQHVVLFLQYLQFLYLKYSQDAFPQMEGFRSPSLSQIMDWVCLLLDAHFTVLVMTPEAKGLLLNLHSFVKSQVRLVSELGKIEGSLQELHKMKAKESIGQYSIEIIELF